jgi:hypothetical protein
MCPAAQRPPWAGRRRPLWAPPDRPRIWSPPVSLPPLPPFSLVPPYAPSGTDRPDTWAPSPPRISGPRSAARRHDALGRPRTRGPPAAPRRHAPSPPLAPLSPVPLSLPSRAPASHVRPDSCDWAHQKLAALLPLSLQPTRRRVPPGAPRTCLAAGRARRPGRRHGPTVTESLHLEAAGSWALAAAAGPGRAAGAAGAARRHSRRVTARSSRPRPAPSRCPFSRGASFVTAGPAP